MIIVTTFLSIVAVIGLIPVILFYLIPKIKNRSKGYTVVSTTPPLNQHTQPLQSIIVSSNAQPSQQSPSQQTPHTQQTPQKTPPPAKTHPQRRTHTKSKPLSSSSTKYRNPSQVVALL